MKAKPLREQHCIECGAPFRTASRLEKLCSKACRQKRQREQIRQWFGGHDRQMRDYWHRYHAERREARNAASLARYYKRKAAT